MLRAVLVDDQESNLSSLSGKLLRNCPQVEIIASCENAEKAIDAIDSLKPDVVFLDIEMPVMNGFSMLQKLTYQKFELIFTTAYDHYALKAIRFSALDYLIKPIEIDELKLAVNRAEAKRIQKSSTTQMEILLGNLASRKNSYQRIAIPTTTGLQFVNINDIIYFEASSNYTHIFLSDNKKHTISRTLKDFEDILPEETFIRIHNSYIINKNFADKYIRGEGGQVVLSNGAVLDVAKRKKTDFLKAIGF